MPVRASGQPRCHVAPCHASRPPWRWTARPLQGPRGQRQAVAPWGPSPSHPGWPPRRVARWPAHRPGPPQAAAPPAHTVAGVLEARPLPVAPGVCVATPGPGRQAPSPHQRSLGLVATPAGARRRHREPVGRPGGRGRGRAHQRWRPDEPTMSGRCARYGSSVCRRGHSPRRCKRRGSMMMVRVQGRGVPTDRGDGLEEGLETQEERSGPSG
jgi:hypothetical protein